jgi:TolB-like protein
VSLGPAAALLASLLAAAPAAAGAAAGGVPDRQPTADDARRRQTIAVLPFENLAVTGKERLDFLREWLADVTTERLSASGGITVVERRAIDRVLAELKLGSSELAGTETRLRLGSLLGARLLVFGSFTAVGEHLRIDARIVDVESGVVMRTHGADGPAAEARELAAALGGELAAGLGLAVAKRAVEARLDDPAALEASEAYYEGLALEKAGRVDDAIDRYRRTLELAPDDREAKNRLLRLLEAAP